MRKDGIDHKSPRAYKNLNFSASNKMDWSALWQIYIGKVCRENDFLLLRYG